MSEGYLHGYAENAIGAIILLHVLERHLIDVHILCTTLRQQAFRRIKIRLTSLTDSALPEFAKVLWHYG